MSIVIVVAAHVALSFVHGLVHLAIPVHVHGWQYGYASVVILTAPVVGAALIRRGRNVAGTWLLLVVGLAALAFEGAYHFLVMNPDHVATVESGRVLFAVTAALSTAGDAVLVAVAGWVLARSSPSTSDR